MKLLEVLASGIRGAENGSVDILVRGTSTRAQIFTEYDGTGAQTPIAALPLDANGGAVLYVNEPVLCRAYDASGNVVRQFTAFETATAVEVISSSFTGTNYQTEVAGASNPTLLSSVLDRWLTSAGTTNFNVLLGGASTTIQTALAQAANLYFNVKAYGALGDGTTDDTTAINAAISAANTGTGIVFFPPGTYKITSALTFSSTAAGVQGTPGSIVTSTVGSINLFTVSAGAQNTFMMRDLTLTLSGALSQAIGASGTVNGLFENVYINSTSAGGPAFTWGSSGLGVTLGGVWSEAEGNVGGGAFRNSGGGQLISLGTKFVTTLAGAVHTTYVPSASSTSILLGCTFAFTAAGALGGYISSGSSTFGFVAGCNFLAPSGGGTVTTAYAASSQAPWTEVGNTFGSTGITNRTFVTPTASDTTAQQYNAIGRQANKFFVASDAAAITLDTANYGIFVIRRTTNAGQTLTLPSTTAGDVVWITIDNASANTPTETLTTVKGLATSGAITANSRYTFGAKAIDVNGSAASWVLVGTPVTWT